MGPSGGISAGHPLTTAAGFEILLKGGNAFDAGVAMLLTGGVLEQDLYSLGGEALVLVYPKREGKVTSVVGQGWAPKAVDVDWYVQRKKTLQGAGLDPSVVPGALHAALTVLEKWGTMSFEQVSARAIDYAENGFPIRQSTVAAVRREQKFFQNWPVNQRYWSKPDGSAFKPGETIKLPTTARTLRRMVEAEPPSAPPAIVSTKATSPARWSPSCTSTTRRGSTTISRSSTRASRNRPRRRIAATPSTSTASAARDRRCCRR
jgi:gamma-glutamyltranspeptidase/glutathione hydrolase